MNSKDSILLSTAYLPPIEYFALLNAYENTRIEKWESYQKQTYRNRCHIYCANGLLSLNIPIERDTGPGTLITQTKIDYSVPWQIKHWRSIVSAYKSSPFFEYYQYDFYPFFQNRDELFLYNYNKKLTELVIKLLSLDKIPGESDMFIKEAGNVDFRNSINPKRSNLDIIKNGQYQQVFAHKFGYISNLSIIDLLFNEGPSSIDFLQLKF
jgi:hypothetical protein